MSNEIWLLLAFIAGIVCGRLFDVLFDGVVDAKVRHMAGPPRPIPPPPPPTFVEWKANRDGTGFKP